MKRNHRGGRVGRWVSPAALALCLTGCLDPGEAGGLVPATVEQDRSLPSVEINGTTVHAEAFGEPDAPLIVMLHSGPGGDYRSLLPYRVLADDGYRVVFWDQRGGGLSQRHDADSYQTDQYLEDLREVVDMYTTREDQPLVFLGASWGAMYATWFISEYGDYGGRVAGAILVEPGAFTSEGLEAYLAAGFPPWQVTSEELNDLLWFAQIMSPRDHERADYMQQLALLAGFPKEHNDPNKHEPAWRSGAVAHGALLKRVLDEGFDWTRGLNDFEPEVLFLRGALNENMPISHQQELASHFQSSKIVTVEDVGHQVLWEKQSQALSHIRTYLNGLEVQP